ncbi:RagB/SusD family nutrient uptake outer membrane protein [Pedobacter changchengzhani]|uniref:RagB/SusD family nutrient uptake outer membrane protein n=1 Tax=Pedobacter changchengzhani TaxID=2529274 RepID=A0A4R5MQC5_9SPHI|nr:RagB/SusD family nutrient uptake outer membrane protein [Pedobacter changchengzhani]TDG38041.1 RagB/SusD family nutrient uptake outer membrane protein [Pedobacter changchengzhani]
MKKKLFLASIVAIAMMIGCKKGSVLDQVKTNDQNESTTFADSARTMQFLTRIYTDIGFSADPRRFGASVGIYSIGDETESNLTAGTAFNIIFQTGGISAINIPTDAWFTTYANIRRVNLLLRNIASTPLSTPLQKRVAGEARFLRAWYYFILLKHYAGIPLIGDAVYEATDPISGKRNTYEACVNYISSECDAAAALLPKAYVGLDYGRVTQGSALGLKSRLLLYAASPLFNGRSDNMDGVLGYPTADVARWTKAAQAAKAVIDLNQYQLYDLPLDPKPGYGFQKVFTLRKNPEYMLALMMAPNRSLESIWDPASRSGSASAWPYQELVDAFTTIKGLPITTDIKSPSNPTGYDAANPYANRDPRFNWTILPNEGMRLNATKTISPVYTYVGAAQDGYGTTSTTKTGYYLRKMLDDNTINNTSSATTERCFPLMRYAEILLNYAEASNEAGDVVTAYEQLKLIRKRAGILPGVEDNYGLPDGLTLIPMRTIIQNERRVELAIEEHRYWDVRRWKIAETVSNQTLHGMKVTKVGTGTPATYTYDLINVRTPVFTAPKWYLWPIPQGEVNKSVDLLQNPGW